MDIELYITVLTYTEVLPQCITEKGVFGSSQNIQKTKLCPGEAIEISTERIRNKKQWVPQSKIAVFHWHQEKRVVKPTNADTQVDGQLSDRPTPSSPREASQC